MTSRFSLLVALLLTAQSVLALSPAEKRQLSEQAVSVLGGNGNVIARWRDAVHVGLVGNISAESAATVNDIVGDVRQLTGLTMTVSQWAHSQPEAYLREASTSPPFVLARCDGAAAVDCPNLIVIFARPQTMLRIARTIPLRAVYQNSLTQSKAPKCFFAPFQRSYVHIVQALVYIRDDLSGPMTRTCLHEEIYQSFGMFSDVSGSDYFSFDNREQPKSITCYDKLLLATIYDRRFRAGAPAFKVVKHFVDQVAKGRCRE